MSASVGGAPEGAPPARAQRFALAGHVRAVEMGAETILLDLRKDKYLSVATPALTRLVAGGEDHTGLRARLLREDVLSPAGVVLAPLPRPIATGLPRGVTPLAFGYACLWARGIVRRRRLERAIEILSAVPRGSRDAAFAYARFEAWRPWYPARSVCLFDSLALARFLLSAGAQFELVFGVRISPFAAHCWIEADGGILNDEAGYCASFAEIMRT